jgi:predicted transcriptional regulator
LTISLTVNKPKRRDKLVIMTEILDIAKKGTSKTHIMFKANLSFSQLNQYLAILSQAKLLERSAFDGRDVYTPTQKGVEFMQKQQQIINLLNSDLHRSNIKTPFFNFHSF